MANVKISDLTSAAAATGTQQFEVNDGFVSKKVTGAQILSYVEGEISSSPTLTGQVSLDDGTASAPSLTNTGDTNTGVFFPAADTVSVATGGTERVTISSSGNVGIGTSSPTSKLHVSGNFYVKTGSNVYQAIIDTATTSYSGYYAVFNSSNIRIGFTGFWDGTKFYAAQTDSTTPLVFGTNNIERFRIGTSGQLGVAGANYGTSGQVLTSNGSGSAPSWTTAIITGAILTYAGTTEPSGWLFCYGQAVSRTTYADLFAVLSTTYGAGDGSTTFNLPDLRGRTVAGRDNMGGISANRLTNQSGGLDGDILGAAGGAETHTLSTAELASHTHGQATNTTLNTAAGTLWSNASANRGSTGGTTVSTGSSSAHNNVQPTFILNYIIKT